MQDESDELCFIFRSAHSLLYTGNEWLPGENLNGSECSKAWDMKYLTHSFIVSHGRKCSFPSNADQLTQKMKQTLIVTSQHIYTPSILKYSCTVSWVPSVLLPTDPTFTLHKVTTAVEGVQDWKRLGAYLGVPLAWRGSREKMFQCFITAIPNASWQTLAGGLYYRQELTALERVTKYFQPQPGMGRWAFRSMLEKRKQ